MLELARLLVGRVAGISDRLRLERRLRQQIGPAMRSAGGMLVNRVALMPSCHPVVA